MSRTRGTMNQTAEFTRSLESVECPLCGGDGRETCDNPDHGFISAIGGETARLGCPCCGHDPDHKVPNGGECDLCDGRGWVTMAQKHEWEVAE
jgi:hypothetical protein